MPVKADEATSLAPQRPHVAFTMVHMLFTELGCARHTMLIYECIPLARDMRSSVILETVRVQGEVGMAQVQSRNSIQLWLLCMCPGRLTTPSLLPASHLVSHVSAPVCRAAVADA